MDVSVQVRYVEMTKEQETAWRAGMALLWEVLVKYQESQNQKTLFAAPDGASSKGKTE